MQNNEHWFNEQIFFQYSDGVFGPYSNSSMFICLAQILHPKSRGTVRLNSTDPYDPPLIDPNYYADESDVKDMVECKWSEMKADFYENEGGNGEIH